MQGTSTRARWEVVWLVPPQALPHHRHGCNRADLSARQALSRERSKLQGAGAGDPVRLQRGAGVNISPGPAQSKKRQRQLELGTSSQSKQGREIKAAWQECG